MIHLKLIRHNLKPTYTEGTLINLDTNEELCDTLEDKVRDADGSGKFEGEEKKVYGKTAIPYGKYAITVTWSPAFQREMVLVRNVPHFSGIRLHWGRTAENSQGCILVGKKEDDGVLANTGMTDKIVKLVKENGNKGIIEIV